MPTMASITVKKADATTDIVYDAIAASGGDNSPAVWRQDTGAVAGLPVGLRPLLQILTKWNGPKTARQVIISYVYPYAVQNTTTGLYSAQDRVVVNNGVMTIPQGIPANVINEATFQYSNLTGSTPIKAIYQTGYAPT